MASGDNKILTTGEKQDWVVASDDEKILSAKKDPGVEGDAPAECTEVYQETVTYTQSDDNEFIARKVSDYYIVCTSADVCKVPKHTPVPFGISEPLSSSVTVAKRTNVNGCEVFVHRSETTKVTGDAPGVRKGVGSGTVGAKAEPIEHSATVCVECSPIVRVGDAFKMNAGNTQGKLVYAPPPKKDAITDEGKIKEDFAKGFCKQMGYSPQECAALQTTDHWKELAESYMDKAEDLYDKATQLTTEDVVSMAEHAVNEVGEQIDSAAHYLQNTSAADIAEDAIETGEAIVGAAGEMAGDALDWIGETYDRLKKADNLSEMAGMAAAAGIDIVNPGKKIGKAYELGQKVDKKLHKPKSNSGKRNGEDGGSSEGTPSQCKKIKIKIDGKDYPSDKAPKPELRSHTEEWTVSTETRRECKQRLTKMGKRDGTDEYQKIVSQDIEDGELPEGHKDYLSNEFGSEMTDRVNTQDGEGAIKIVTARNKAIDEAASGTRAGPTNKHNYHHIRPRWAHGHLGNVGGNESGNLTPSPVRHQTSEGIHGWWDEKLDKADGSVKRQLTKCPKIKKCKSKMDNKLTECNVTKLAKCVKKASKGKSKLVVIYRGDPIR